MTDDEAGELINAALSQAHDGFEADGMLPPQMMAVVWSNDGPVRVYGNVGGREASINVLRAGIEVVAEAKVEPHAEQLAQWKKRGRS